MTFLGLPLATLAPIGAVAAVALVGLYVLRLRRRPVPVPFAPLWDRVLADRDASAWYSRLQRLLSLLLQLTLLGLLLLALSDPRPAVGAGGGRHFVLLLDASASMQATDVAPSRLARARQEALRLVRGLGPGDRLQVVRLGATATPLTAFLDDPAALERAVLGVEAGDTGCDLRLGLAHALDALSGLDRAEVIYVGDGALTSEALEGLPLAAVTVRHVPVGEGGDNLAITAFSARRYPLDRSRVEVFLTLFNPSAREAFVDLELDGDDRPLDRARVRVAAGERLQRVWKDLGGAHRTLTARVVAVPPFVDHLPADDRAYALVPERRRARVALVTAGNTYLEAALLLDEYLDVTTVTPAEVATLGGFDVAILDGVAPPLPPGEGGVVYLNPPETGSPVRRGKALTDFGFDTWDQKSPLLRFLALGDVQVARGHALLPEKGDRVLGASEAGALLVAGRREGRRFVALGFDPRDSDFVLRPAWPLFVVNVVDAFVEERLRHLSSFRTGEAWEVAVPAGVTRARHVAPDGTERRVPASGGLARLFGEQAGIHRLELEGLEEPVRFAANLVDESESRLSPPEATGAAAGFSSGLPALATGVRRELWGLLLLVAAALSVVEWLTYHRRWTV